MDSAIGQPGSAARAGKRPPFDRYLSANIALWVLTYLLTTVRVVMGMDTPLRQMIENGVRRALVCAVAVGFCVVIQRLLQRSRRQSVARRLALAAALSVAGAVGWGLVNHLAFYLILPRQPFEGEAGELVAAVIRNLSVLIWSFIAWCAIVVALDYDEQAREQTVRMLEAQRLAAESQNQMLRYQINPHFLFNTLNALSSLILQKDVVRAERMVLSLSNFLRASLEATPGDRITLAEELDVQDQYLAIEQERFGDRLRLRRTLPPELATALAPGLILQPLVENAVKYGVARTTRPVTVEITAEVRGARLVVSVRDDGAPDPVSKAAKAPQALGVGLANVRRRLEVLYGEAGKLTAGPQPGGGYVAEIELPLERR